MEIIRAKSDDADTLTAIAHAAKRHWGYPERWIEAWKDILTMRPEFIAANTAFCAKGGTGTIGFYVLTQEEDGLHLDHLWIHPNSIGRGIGRALFKHAVEQARAAGSVTIKIEADPNAEGFYRQMGAKRVGTSMSEVEGTPRELPILEYRWSNTLDSSHSPLDE